MEKPHENLLDRLKKYVWDILELNHFALKKDVHPLCLLCKHKCKRPHSFWGFQEPPEEFCKSFEIKEEYRNHSIATVILVEDLREATETASELHDQVQKIYKELSKLNVKPLTVVGYEAWNLLMSNLLSAMSALEDVEFLANTIIEELKKKKEKPEKN